MKVKRTFATVWVLAFCLLGLLPSWKRVVVFYTDNGLGVFVATLVLTGITVWAIVETFFPRLK